MRTQLVAERAGAKAAVIDATETLQYQITQLAIQQGQLASASRALDVFDKDMQKAIEAFLAENARKAERGGAAGRGPRTEARQGGSGDRTSDAEGADRRNRSGLGADHDRTGREQRPGDHAHRSRGRRARDRGLCPEQGHRLREAGTGGGREDRVLPVHPIRHDRRAGDASGSRLHSRAGGQSRTKATPRAPRTARPSPARSAPRTSYSPSRSSRKPPRSASRATPCR